ncbi:MAG TPA: transglycosylase SLT domain-containing protein [Gemmatimonadales bacterium]|nr:transglycosylase SLT domain-containing protein [Gemmatimonadales bacterium]
MIKRLLGQLTVVTVGALCLVGLGGVSTLLAARHGAVSAVPAADSAALAAANAALADTRHELERAHQILEFSGRYAIPADLSAEIYDHAVAEGIHASVGFQLVKIESDFRNGAESDAVAIGLTQLRLPTARAFEPMVAPSDLMNPDLNLRLGFRYLHALLNRFDQNLPLALEAYNKGPTLVAAQQDLGNDVRGKYSHAVLSGLHQGT